MFVCRRIEDHPTLTHARLMVHPKGTCGRCQKLVYLDAKVSEPPICIHCCNEEAPGEVIFVELEPDEFGRRSMGKSVAEVMARGDWHKTGAWLSQQNALSNIE